MSDGNLGASAPRKEDNEFAALLLESWWGWCAPTDGHKGKNGEVQLPVADVLSAADIWQDFPAVLGFTSQRACGARLGVPGS